MMRALFLIVLGVLTRCDPPAQEADLGADQLPYYDEATFTPKWFESESAVPEDFHQIPSFSLSNQQGEMVTERDVQGKIFVVDFFFTSCPGICPKMTDNMLLIQDTFIDDEDVLLLSHSVTPTLDSVSVLAEYADRKGVIASKWHLLTGDRSQIYDLGRHQYFVEEDLGLNKKAEDFIHTENFVLIDGNRHIRGIYNGLNKTAVRQLITDIKTLKKSINS
ncbi:MAG: SCO family protein [Bacteroidota bacterium]